MMPKYCAADLRHAVLIEQHADTVDSVGGQTLVWSTFASVWAMMKPYTGREVVASQQLQSQVTHKIVIRYYAGVTAGMRFNFNGRLMNIRHVINPEERSIWMELLCDEGVAT